MDDGALQSWIDGAAVPGADRGRVLTLDSPWTGEPVEAIRAAGADTVGAAVQNARAAYLAQRFAPAAERIAWLDSAAGHIEDAKGEIVDALIETIGKPRRAAQFETLRSAQFVRACAAHLADFGGDTIPLDAAKAGAGLFGFTNRVPYGVVAAVTPFNAPANLLLQKVAPALAVGNAVVAKPALEGTRVALIVADCFSKAGLPAGLFNVVAGDGQEACSLVGHRDVSFVTVTGGTSAGHALAAAAGAKPFVGELGGNSANIVCRDANLADAVARLVPSAFDASGQQCISAQRIIVEEPVLEQFLELFVSGAKRLKVGDPSLDDTDVGPVVNVRSADRIMAAIADAEAAGAEITLRPTVEGCVISPAIVLTSDRELDVVREEIFGPVAVVLPARDVDDAIRIANASEFGLQASCFTGSLDTAFRVSRELVAGSVWINEGSRFRLDNYPFGGVGASGYGREGVRYAMEGFTQWKFTGIRCPKPAGAAP